MPVNRFDTLSILLTGAAGGFGRRAAERFAQEGARLVIADIARKPLEDLADALRATGAEVTARVADVAREEDAAALVQAALDAHGRLDIAVNNAGIAHPFAKLADLDLATMERMVRVNLVGTFLALKYQIPAMERTGGAILNVASVAGVAGAPLLAAYAAAKHGIIGLTRSAAVEYARSNVRVNAICPSFAETSMVTGFLDAMRGGPDAGLARIVSAIPLRRLATVDEVVEAMLFLCAPTNTFMTGHALVLDGGLTAA